MVRYGFADLDFGFTRRFVGNISAFKSNSLNKTFGQKSIVIFSCHVKNLILQ